MQDFGRVFSLLRQMVSTRLDILPLIFAVEDSKWVLSTVANGLFGFFFMRSFVLNFIVLKSFVGKWVFRESSNSSSSSLILVCCCLFVSCLNIYILIIYIIYKERCVCHCFNWKIRNWKIGGLKSSLIRMMTQKRS